MRCWLPARRLSKPRLPSGPRARCSRAWPDGCCGCWERCRCSGKRIWQKRTARRSTMPLSLPTASRRCTRREGRCFFFPRECRTRCRACSPSRRGRPGWCRRCCSGTAGPFQSCQWGSTMCKRSGFGRRCWWSSAPLCTWTPPLPTPRSRCASSPTASTGLSTS